LSASLANAHATPESLVAFKKRFMGKVARRLIHNAAGRADYFSAPIPEDLSVFKGRFPEFHGHYSQLNYGNAGDTFAGARRLEGGENILVGNSASFSNNHLEIFGQLADLDISGRKIVVPLSYGNPEYRDEIVARGRRLFGEAFTPLIDMLSLEEYLSVVASCNVVIMNHKRQQALGNIGAALYHGAHLFLDEANTTVDFFRSRGAFIYTTKELKADDLPRDPLPAAAVATNRRVLETFWGSEQVVRNAEALIGQLNR